MNPIRHLRRVVGVLAGLACAWLGLAAAAPAAFAGSSPTRDQLTTSLRERSRRAGTSTRRCLQGISTSRCTRPRPRSTPS
jgi:hypothetical protein